MEMTEREKGLLGLFRRLESEKIQDDVIYQTEAMVRAQEALRADYGLAAASPLYAERNPAPMGAA
jgi:hypothetical protein